MDAYMNNIYIYMHVGSGRGLPGLYFYYEISPVQAEVEVRNAQGGFWRFFTSVSAMIGGSFVFFGLVDTAIAYLSRLCKKSLLR